MCGGTPVVNLVELLAEGLSPRVRGNPNPPGPNLGLAGSIPACAGEPSASPRRFPRSGVYPRVCGGTEAAGDRGAYARGLSPRVRGNLRRRPSRPRSGRSIPACAGEPGPAAATLAAVKVYPRVCGGTKCNYSEYALYAGLSPRVRGNPGVGGTADAITRSIPACAGEPVYSVQNTGLKEVYPRVCGGTWATGRRWT